MKVVKLAYTTNKDKTINLKVKLQKPEGDEATVSFTLEYDPSVLQFKSSKAGKNAPPSTSVGHNVSQERQGKLGCLLASAYSFTASPTDGEWAVLSFDVLSKPVTGKTSVKFTGLPTVQSFALVNGGVVVPATYKGGTIAIK
jgi:hypothetical protein